MPAKYIHLANLLRSLILQNTGSGVYKLPSEHALCQQYHVSRQTVRAALSLLTKEGLIEKRHGSGSFSTGLGRMANTIALIVNNAEEYTTPAFLSNIKSVLGEKGYSTKTFVTYSKVSAEREILAELRNTPIRGLIAEGTKTALPNPNLDLYDALMEKGIAVLFAGGRYPAFTSSIYIQDDNHYGGYLLSRHLIQEGHTQIAGVFKMDDLQGLERYSGFATALRDYDIPLTDDLLIWYTAELLEALQTKSDTGFFSPLLRRNKGMYSAVVCQNDEIAYWLIRELSYAGIRVPEDVSVVSFDNSYMSDLSSVHITTLAHDNQTLGTASASALLKMIQGESVHSENLTWKLLKKGSDAPH